MPAVEAAGLTPIRPIAEGADNIVAEIITNLETADLVLCDISIYNPNVFFELGVRTALDRPVCYVVDDKTERVPFDTNIINHAVYDSSLTVYSAPAEAKKLTKHIKATIERSDGRNPLWKYFGISSPARPFEATGSTDERLELLDMRLEGIELLLREQRSGFLELEGTPLKPLASIMDELEVMLPGGVNIESTDDADRVLMVASPEPLVRRQRTMLRRWSTRHQINLYVRESDDPVEFFFGRDGGMQKFSGTGPEARETTDPKK